MSDSASVVLQPGLVAALQFSTGSKEFLPLIGHAGVAQPRRTNLVGYAELDCKTEARDLVHGMRGAMQRSVFPTVVMNAERITRLFSRRRGDVSKAVLVGESDYYALLISIRDMMRHISATPSITTGVSPCPKFRRLVICNSVWSVHMPETDLEALAAGEGSLNALCDLETFPSVEYKHPDLPCTAVILKERMNLLGVPPGGLKQAFNHALDVACRYPAEKKAAALPGRKAGGRRAKKPSSRQTVRGRRIVPVARPSASVFLTREEEPEFARRVAQASFVRREVARRDNEAYARIVREAAEAKVQAHRELERERERGGAGRSPTKRRRKPPTLHLPALPKSQALAYCHAAGGAAASMRVRVRAV
jgi:hypothetical protein